MMSKKNSKNEQLLDVLPDNLVNTPSFKNLSDTFLVFISWITGLDVQKLRIFAIFAS